MRISNSYYSFLVLIAVVAVMLVGCSRVNGDVQLVKNGQSQYRIVLESNASGSEKFAADQLQHYLQQISGCQLPIVQAGVDQYDQNSHIILLGCGPIAQKLGVNPSPKQLGQQGFMLQRVGDNIVIAGSSQAGTMYGVFRFLQRYLGVRWYAPGATKVPKSANITIRNLSKSGKIEKPAILHRRTSYRWNGKTPEFLAQVGYNYGRGGDDHKYGVQYAFLGTCHSYFRFIHPRDYFNTHPEYFSEIGGIRRQNETQLCLTNPEVLDIVTEKMLAMMKKHPNLSQFNFSQMDYYNYCQCPKCSTMNNKYKTPGGTQFWFVNELAKRTSKVFPDKLIGTLAYMYTEEVPLEMKMHPNVAVWLCHFAPSCDSHPIKTCPRNADYKRRATDWSKITDHMYIWHYTVDFLHYHAPFPNFRSLAADMKFYKGIGVEGIYLQGMGQSGGGGEFHLLRPYYMMQLAWDPDQNPDAVIKDFLQGYYGAAWKPLWKYIVMLHDKVEKDNIHMHLYTNPAQGFLTDEIMARAEALFDEAAKAVADNPQLRERVETARMAITYASLFPRNGYKIKNNRLVFPSIATNATAQQFVEQMKARGYRYYREWDNDLKRIPSEKAIMNSSPKIHTISNEHLSLEIVPALAGRALRIIDRKSGKCITAYNTKRNLEFPFCGGLENRTGEIYSFFGFFEPAKVINQSDDSITIALKTFDGLRLERTITLDAKLPVFRVRAVLTNTDKKPRAGRLRSHLSLDLGPVRSTKVQYIDQAGKQIDENMTHVLAAMREGIYSRSSDIPAGQWSFTGKKGLQVIHRFDPKIADQVWLGCWPEDSNELEVEMWSKPQTLKPNQSLELNEEYEVLEQR